VKPWTRAAVWLATRPASTVTPEGAGLLKRRTTLGRLAVLATASQATRFVVLPERDWFARETWLYRALYGVAVEPRGAGAIWLPRLPGERLDRAVVDLEPDGALAACRAALATLADHHTRLSRNGHGFSHADATAKNALFDAADGRVRFFDFETAHPLRFSPAARRADDLATLAGSLALALGPWIDDALASALVDEVPERELLEAVSARDLAAVGRVPMSESRHAAWVAAVRSRLLRSRSG
jgi:hypothetical protein